MTKTPLPDLSALPFRPAAVLTLVPGEDATITDLIAPLLRDALIHRYGADYPESVFHLHLAAILERQELMPFAVDGVALAYPDLEGAIRVDRTGLDEPIVVVGVSEAGTAWRLPRTGHSTDALDGKPVHVVFLILSGDTGADLRLKAAIARWSRTAALGGDSNSSG